MKAWICLDHMIFYSKGSVIGMSKVGEMVSNTPNTRDAGEYPHVQ